MWCAIGKKWNNDDDDDDNAGADDWKREKKKHVVVVVSEFLIVEVGWGKEKDNEKQE